MTKSISEAEIWDKVNHAYERMNLEQRRLWEVIKITPEKWNQRNNGFWVVAIIGDKVIWYNDIEGGFNLSVFTEYTKINEYWQNRDPLEHVVQNILNEIQHGYDEAGYTNHPQATG